MHFGVCVRTSLMAACWPLPLDRVISLCNSYSVCTGATSLTYQCDLRQGWWQDHRSCFLTDSCNIPHVAFPKIEASLMYGAMYVLQLCTHNLAFLTHYSFSVKEWRMCIECFTILYYTMLYYTILHYTILYQCCYC